MSLENKIPVETKCFGVFSKTGDLTFVCRDMQMAMKLMREQDQSFISEVVFYE